MSSLTFPANPDRIRGAMHAQTGRLHALTADIR